MIVTLGAGSVAVETGDAGLGKFLAQSLFELLGAFTEEIDILRIALGTFLRNGLRVAAVVALKAVSILVMRKADTAVGTLNGGAAAAANDGPRIAAPIDQDQRLSVEGEALLDAFVQRGRDGAGPV